MDLQGWANGAWADGSWVESAWGEPLLPTPQEERRRAVSGGGRKKRLYLELDDGELIRVKDLADADRILRELRKEEKKLAKDEKRLTVLVKKYEVLDTEGALYRQTEKQIQAVETRLDERVEKIFAMYAQIQAKLQESEEDEEELLLLSN